MGELRYIASESLKIQASLCIVQSDPKFFSPARGSCRQKLFSWDHANVPSALSLR